MSVNEESARTYQVIARKWRPQQFEDLVGQETVARTLQNAIRQNRIAHAYLFTGTRGVGKTSSARILAKALNCEQGPTPNPCDQCTACNEIMNGSCIDVLEIDAASNRGINEIRELRENVQYAPTRDRFKIFIIDEVHMLTTEAFNALLKTLEEPPGHVKFILATTELYKIPQTILSRCQQYDFRSVPFGLIFDRLRHILAAENVQLSDEALRLVVKAAGGSMRDAQSALQKILSFGEGRIPDEDVAALLGVIRHDYVHSLLRAIQDQDRPSILRIVDRLSESGHDLQAFLRQVVETLRHATVLKVTQSEEHLAAFSEDEREFLRSFAGQIEVETLIRYYDLLVKSDNEIRTTPFPRFHVEMALLRLVSLPHLRSLEEIVRFLRDHATDAPAPQAAPPGAQPGRGPAPPPPAPSRFQPPPMRPDEPMPPRPAGGPRMTPPPSAPNRTPGRDREAPPWDDAPPAEPHPAPQQARPTAPDFEAKPAPRSGPPPAPRAAVREMRLRDIQDALASRKEMAALAPILRTISWKLDGQTLTLGVESGSFAEKVLRQADTQDSIRRICREQFGQEPVISLIQQTARTQGPTEDDRARHREQQRALEETFQEDPTARVILDKLPGRWTFRKQDNQE